MERADLSVVKRSTGLQGRRIAADYVADALRRAIQSGKLPDGAVLNQAAIAEHLGVSRVPVREAMRQLLAEGLIQSQAHHVAVVRGLSLDRIGEIYNYRALLEGYITERAAEKITDADLEKLRAKNEEMRTVADHARWLRLNGEFHEIVLAAGGDETGLELTEQLRLRAERYVRMWSGGEGFHRPAEVAEEHGGIIACLEARDGPGAAEAVRRHILHTGERLLAYGEAARGEAAAADGA